MAAALDAEKFILRTDVSGVIDSKNELVSSLTEEQAEAMIRNGEISGGMIPKVKSCLNAIRGGVPKAHIIDGRVAHALLLEILTDEGIGTEIVRDRAPGL